MCLHVKLPVELPHGDGLGVDDERVYRREGEPVRGQLALDGRQGVAEGLVTL